MYKNNIYFKKLIEENEKKDKEIRKKYLNLIKN